MMKTKYCCVLFLMVLMVGCSTSDITSPDETVDLERYFEEVLPSRYNVEELRTQLSDVYTSRTNEIPEAFSRIKVEKEVERNLYEGYRVQIYSGRSVSIADTIAADFRSWADTTIAGYDAETYVTFRTPYYKVHVGDFHDRDKANSFSKIVKRNFPDAWVVYDRVEPENVPADTVDFSIK